MLRKRDVRKSHEEINRWLDECLSLMYFSKQREWNLNSKSLLRIIHAFLNISSVLSFYIIYFSSSSFFSFPLRYNHPLPPVYAAYRSFRGSNCGCLASRSDSRHVITRWLDDRRGIRRETERREKREERAGLEGGEWMIGMACTKFGSFSSKGSSKNLVSVIPDQRPGRCGRVSIRLSRN